MPPHQLVMFLIMAASTQPASTQPTEPQLFQPGVAIDWRAPAVIIDGAVVLREGPLEFAACFQGKQHESLVLMEADPTHVYQAVGLIGLKPGHPPKWDDTRQRYLPPTGAPLEILVEWTTGAETRRANIFEWITEVEYARPARPRPWLFAGSVVRDDGTLAAAHTGEGAALVDFPTSLFALTQRHTSANVALWAVARTPRIPPLETPVKLILRPAERPDVRVRMDFRGALFVNDRFVSTGALIAIITDQLRFTPEAVITIRNDALLDADVSALRRQLAAAGLEKHIRFEPPRTDAPAATRPASATAD